MKNSGLEKTKETASITQLVATSTEKNSNNGTTEQSRSIFVKSLENSGIVKSASMNLIDDTAEHLFDLMISLEKKVTTENLESTIGLTCTCADQIHKLLRLKLDVLKTAGKPK